MKRDMELVRSILLEVEKSARTPMESLIGIAGGQAADNYIKLANHLTMLVEGGLLRGIKRGTPNNPSGIEWRELELGWQGHEFLDNVRDPEIWRRTKEGASKVGGMSLDIMVGIAKEYAKEVIKEKLGISL